jgi:hypothetical protein
MARLIVTAAASPLFGDFLMVVSVSADADGQPTTGLKPPNFKIADMASLNHAVGTPRVITDAVEGPPGFYIVSLKPSPPVLPGHYVFGVAVTAKVGHGQTVAVGDLPV